MRRCKLFVQAVAVLTLCCAGAGAALAGSPAAPASAPAAPRAAATITNPGGICVWSCQQNPSGSWSYWFARNLSDCAVTSCQPRGGSSPSGTPCDPGDPDIPGDCSTTVGVGGTLAAILAGAPSCPAAPGLAAAGGAAR